MATFRLSIIGGFTAPTGTTGHPFPELSSVKHTNDLYPNFVWVFNDTSAKNSIAGRFTVPKDYVGTAKIVLSVYSTATSGNMVWDFDYRAIADNESTDPTTHQESVSSGAVAVPGTTLLRETISINLTSANLAVDDIVEFLLSRDGADAADTVAAALVLAEAYFEYDDA